jgi:hypothetical protein
MQLFSRRVLMAGPPSRIMEYATDMRAYVTDRTGREIALWQGVFGGPVGTFVYAMRVEGLADYRALSASLLGDSGYHQKIASGADLMAGPAEDTLATPIHGELGNESPPVGAFAQITTAVIANGHYEEAFGWGVDMAQHVESITGVRTMFLANVFGAFGSVTWIAVTPDAEGVDAANQAMWSDSEYMKRLGDASHLFLPGSGHEALVTRIA